MQRRSWTCCPVDGAVDSRMAKGASHLTPDVGSHDISLALPLSATNRTPSIVTLVSAMFVARIILRVPSGAASNTLFCAIGK